MYFSCYTNSNYFISHKTETIFVGKLPFIIRLKPKTLIFNIYNSAFSEKNNNSSFLLICCEALLFSFDLPLNKKKN